MGELIHLPIYTDDMPVICGEYRIRYEGCYDVVEYEEIIIFKKHGIDELFVISDGDEYQLEMFHYNLDGLVYQFIG